MLKIVLLICLSAVALCSNQFGDDPFISGDTVRRTNIFLKKQWNNYKKTYQLSFSADEEEFRLKIYRENIKFINYFNEEDHSFKLAENHFTHLKQEEYLQLLGPTQQNKNTFYVGGPIQNENHDNIPDKDWSKNAGVSPVKQQGSCSAGHSFAAIAAVESLRYIKLRSFTDLSEQDVIDCSGSYQNSGCTSGNVKDVFRYVMTEGVVPEAYYPFVEMEGRCKRPQLISAPIIKIMSFQEIPRGDEDALSRAVYSNGPVAASIDASQKTFRFYSCGVYVENLCRKDNPNHAVLVTGIQSSSTPVYLLKNSFGTAWGDKGFMRFARYRGNMCGIASNAAYPL